MEPDWHTTDAGGFDQARTRRLLQTVEAITGLLQKNSGFKGRLSRTVVGSLPKPMKYANFGWNFPQA